MKTINIISGKEFWDLLVKNWDLFCNKDNHGTTFGNAIVCHMDDYDFWYRSTQYSAWEKAKFVWCAQRDYYYEKSVNTRKNSKELRIELPNTFDGKGCSHSVWELNEFDHDRIGITRRKP